MFSYCLVGCAFSSVTNCESMLNHLPYKQRVNGSNPLVPTTDKASYLDAFFYAND